MISKVIAGDFENYVLAVKNGKLAVSNGSAGRIIDASTVTGYEVVTEDVKKSAASGVARGIAGGLLLGGVGMLAGAVSAKNKGTHQVAVEFVDGKRSLLEMDDAFYKRLVKDCFESGKPKLSAEELAASDEEFSKKSRKRTGCALWALLFAVLLVIGVIALIKCSPEPQGSFEIVSQSGIEQYAVVKNVPVTGEIMEAVAQSAKTRYSSQSPVMIFFFDDAETARQWNAYSLSGEQDAEKDRHFVGIYRNTGNLHNFDVMLDGLGGDMERKEF